MWRLTIVLAVGCGSSATPDAGPDPCLDQPAGDLCVGDSLYRCALGKTAFTKPCATGCTNGFCNGGDGTDTRCNTTATTTDGVNPGFCNINDHITCSGNMIVGHEPCAANQCASNYFAFCTNGIQPDPTTCETGGVYRRCMGANSVRCIGEYPSLVEPCGSGCNATTGTCN